MDVRMDTLFYVPLIPITFLIVTNTEFHTSYLITSTSKALASYLIPTYMTIHFALSDQFQYLAPE